MVQGVIALFVLLVLNSAAKTGEYHNVVVKKLITSSGSSNGERLTGGAAPFRCMNRSGYQLKLSHFLSTGWGPLQLTELSNKCELIKVQYSPRRFRIQTTNRQQSC